LGSKVFLSMYLTTMPYQRTQYSSPDLSSRLKAGAGSVAGCVPMALP
jgi:hypothetical protein